MSFWTEIHWSEGMFLRPHHLQAAQRWMETVQRASHDAVRPFGWGFVHLQIAKEPLENFTLRVDRCTVRFKDGTWACIPDNTEVAALDFTKAMEAAHGVVEVYLGVPRMQEVRANSISLEHPERVVGTPRYSPHPVTRRDENTGENPQTLYIRRMRAQLFLADQDMADYDVVRLGRIRRSDRPGAVPEFEKLGAGPLLAIQADPGVSALVRALVDEIEANNDSLSRGARESNMQFTDGLPTSTEHLLKLHAINEGRAHLAALLHSPLTHPYDVYVAFARIVGNLSIFHEDRSPGPLPPYDHDHPGETLDRMRAMIQARLLSTVPNFEKVPFVRKHDDRQRVGLQVELKRKWLDDNLELFIGLEDKEHATADEVLDYVRRTFNFKVASPNRAGLIQGMAVRGLGLETKASVAGKLQVLPGLHYFRVVKTVSQVGTDRTDYWRECEAELGVRISMTEGQIAAMERLKPTLYVVLRKA